MNFNGLFLVAIGIVYLVKPDIFKRWIWTRTSIAQRTLSPKNYLRYMRGLGVLLIILGVIFLIHPMH